MRAAKRAASELDVHRQSARFLYAVVADALKKRIETGIYGPGERIPTISQLAEEFGVSGISIRQALRDLSLQGYTVSKQGLGVFVSQRRKIVRTLSVDGVVPIEEDMRRSGVKAGLLDQGSSTVTSASRSFLRVLAPANRKLVKLDRILLADGAPVGLDVIWLTEKLASKLDPFLRGQFLMSRLEDVGVTVSGITYQVEAATADDVQANQLGILTGFPLLVIRFFPKSIKGDVVLVGETTTRADHFTYQFGAGKVS